MPLDPFHDRTAKTFFADHPGVQLYPRVDTEDTIDINTTNLSITSDRCLILFDKVNRPYNVFFRVQTFSLLSIALHDGDIFIYSLNLIFEISYIYIHVANGNNFLGGITNTNSNTKSDIHVCEQHILKPIGRH